MTTSGTSTVFPGRFTTRRSPRSLGVELEKEVVYFPRRAYDMWNTRYFIVPYWHGGWNDENRGYASFIFETERIYPDPDRFSNPNGGKEAEKNWIETKDFQVLRNLQEFPRAWVVHDARATIPVHRTFAGDSQRSHAGDSLRRGPDLELERRQPSSLRPAPACLGRAGTT